MPTLGDELRNGFLLLLEEAGTDCDAGGEPRKALLQKADYGMMKFKFAGEFAIHEGDRIRNGQTEQLYAVTGCESVSKMNAFHHFEVTASAIVQSSAAETEVEGETEETDD
jgi:hypothetical protein